MKNTKDIRFDVKYSGIYRRHIKALVAILYQEGSPAYMLLIEMHCKDWEHNRVNAGIIELCHRSYPKEKIKLYAEEEHINGIVALIKGGNIQLSSEKIDYDDWRSDCIKCSDKYAELLISIIEAEPDEKNIIILTGNEGIVNVVADISRRYDDRKIFIIMHAALEEVVNKPHIGVKQRVYNFLFEIKNKVLGRKITNEPSLKGCIGRCTAINCYFVIYAPKYRHYLSGKLDNDILERFIFLHHPLYDPGSYYIPENDKLVIGIYGQAVNQNAYDIIKCYNEKYDNGNVQFRIMTQEHNPILNLKNVTRLFEQDHVSNKDLEQARREFDYVLIPYDSKQYKITASGILCDVISEEIPVLMLDSPFLEYYGQYGIGIMEHSVDNMAERIAEVGLKKGSTEKYRQAEHKLKEVILRENIDAFKEMIG